MSQDTKQTKTVDLSIFDVQTGANEGFDQEILTPQGNPSGVIFRLLGKDGDIFKELRAKQMRNRMARAQQSGKAPTEDDIEDDVVELLASCTVGWSNLSLPYSRENAEAIYRDKKYVSIREQVDYAINNRANFTKG
jgi:hypothetical protein